MEVEALSELSGERECWRVTSANLKQSHMYVSVAASEMQKTRCSEGNARACVPLADSTCETKKSNLRLLSCECWVRTQ